MQSKYNFYELWLPGKSPGKPDIVLRKYKTVITSLFHFYSLSKWGLKDYRLYEYAECFQALFNFAKWPMCIPKKYAATT